MNYFWSVSKLNINSFSLQNSILTLNYTYSFTNRHPTKNITSGVNNNTSCDSYRFMSHDNDNFKTISEDSHGRICWKIGWWWVYRYSKIVAKCIYELGHDTLNCNKTMIHILMRCTKNLTKDFLTKIANTIKQPSLQRPPSPTPKHKTTIAIKDNNNYAESKDVLFPLFRLPNDLISKTSLFLTKTDIFLIRAYLSFPCLFKSHVPTNLPGSLYHRGVNWNWNWAVCLITSSTHFFSTYYDQTCDQIMVKANYPRAVGRGWKKEQKPRPKRFGRHQHDRFMRVAV